MDYSVDMFWAKRFSGVLQQATAKPLVGWTTGCQGDESYVSAKLSLRDGFDDLGQNVWLIGAPGAVGKSTLANEICAATGAVYVDLATAATVAGNYMVGGLVYTNLLSAWTAGTTAILIDALDEARLRVTQSGFEAFLEDVANVAAMGKFPVVVLGRVGIIEEAWTILNEKKALDPPIFDIELFEPEQAERFVLARLVKLSKQAREQEKKLEYPDLASSLESHNDTYVSAIKRVVSGLQALSAQDGNRFVGYAPVLDAVAKVIASESNPARIGDEMQRVLEGKVLNSLASQILQRETGKLIKQVESAMPQVPAGLFGPEEQLERLGAILFRMKQPPMPPQLAQHQVAVYEQAVKNLLPQHPFLDGTGAAPSSAVFAACIVADALRRGKEDFARAAEAYASSAQHTPNPFLYDFYEGSAGASSQVPTEHVGLIFESVLAKAKPGDSVRLSVEGELEALNLSIEIVIQRANEQPTRLEFTALSGGTLRLGRRVSGVSIDAEGTAVEFGTADQLELVAPIFVSAKSLKLFCNQVVVKAEPHLTGENTVILEAGQFIADPGLPAPVVRQGATLQVSWPDAASYPWTSFAAASSHEEDPQTTDALRTLRRLTLAFRSHSKGELARFKDKIEHQRMLKGDLGWAVLKKLMADKVITLRGNMYYLDPNALGARVGASFVNVNLKLYSAETRAYLQNLM